MTEPANTESGDEGEEGGGSGTRPGRTYVTYGGSLGGGPFVMGPERSIQVGSCQGMEHARICLRTR